MPGRIYAVAQSKALKEKKPVVAALAPAKVLKIKGNEKLGKKK